MIEQEKAAISWIDSLGLLRIAGYLEGTTLITLLFVAVPLKRIAELPEIVSFMGPVHGFTFVAYIVMTINVVSGGEVTGRDSFRLIGAALVPFGTFINDRFLVKKHQGRL